MARLALAALLFTQAALAAASCDFGQRSAAQAVAALNEACCPDQGESETLGGNANLCLMHCTSDMQNVVAAGLTLQGAAAVAVLTVSPALSDWRVGSRRLAPASYAFAAPPVRILTHNLRI